MDNPVFYLKPSVAEPYDNEEEHFGDKDDAWLDCGAVYMYWTSDREKVFVPVLRNSTKVINRLSKELTGCGFVLIPLTILSEKTSYL
jgi:hypothetical protein